jgi:hypothetical protein
MEAIMSLKMRKKRSRSTEMDRSWKKERKGREKETMNREKSEISQAINTSSLDLLPNNRISLPLTITSRDKLLLNKNNFSKHSELIKHTDRQGLHQIIIEYQQHSNSLNLS